MEGNKAWYKKYKASDLNFAPYFNSNINLTDKDSISVGFRYQWNWLRAGDMKDTLHTHGGQQENKNNYKT